VVASDTEFYNKRFISHEHDFMNMNNVWPYEEIGPPKNYLRLYIRYNIGIIGLVFLLI